MQTALSLKCEHTHANEGGGPRNPRGTSEAKVEHGDAQHAQERREQEREAEVQRDAADEAESERAEAAAVVGHQHGVDDLDCCGEEDDHDHVRDHRH